MNWDLFWAAGLLLLLVVLPFSLLLGVVLLPPFLLWAGAGFRPSPFGWLCSFLSVLGSPFLGPVPSAHDLSFRFVCFPKFSCVWSFSCHPPLPSVCSSFFCLLIFSVNFFFHFVVFLTHLSLFALLLIFSCFFSFSFHFLEKEKGGGSTRDAFTRKVWLSGSPDFIFLQSRSFEESKGQRRVVRVGCGYGCSLAVGSGHLGAPRVGRRRVASRFRSRCCRV